MLKSLVGDLGMDFEKAPAPVPEPEIQVQEAQESNVDENDLIPDEFKTDAHDDPDALVNDLVGKVKLSDKELKGDVTLAQTSPSDRPEDDEFIGLGAELSSSASTNSRMQTQLAASLKALL